MRKRADAGQILVGVIVMMVVLAILVPAMILWVQNETRWSMKQQRNMSAFQLAEAAIDRGYARVTVSTGDWNAIQAGNIPSTYLFNTTYTDLSSGTYTVKIASGPEEQQVTLYGVGRDYYEKETRAIKAIYTNSPLGDIAIMGGTGVDFSGNNMTVNWGAIVSPKSINTDGNLYPQFYSAADIDLDTTVPGNATPNEDTAGVWWHSYYAGIPPMPKIQFAAYQKLAEDAGAPADVDCGASYYIVGDHQLGDNAGSSACTDVSGNTYYITGNVTELLGHIIGNVIVIGNFTTGNGSLAGAAETVEVPRTAWKQYGYTGAWASYRSEWDATKPAAFPGKNSSYKSPEGQTTTTSAFGGTLSPVIHGFVYVGGNFSGPGGGGNVDFVVGVIYVKGYVSLNSSSHVAVYYDTDAASAIMTSNIYLTRESWEDQPNQGWPSTAP